MLGRMESRLISEDRCTTLIRPPIPAFDSEVFIELNAYAHGFAFRHFPLD